MYGYKKIQGFLWKLCWLKNWRMWGFTPKSTNGGRDILSGECRTFCVLTLVNIISKFPMKNRKFLKHLSSKFSRFYVFICMVIKRYKVFFENFVLSGEWWVSILLHSPYLVAHYSGTIMSAMASHITDVSLVCSVVCSGVDQRKHQSSAPLAFVRGIQR